MVFYNVVKMEYVDENDIIIKPDCPDIATILWKTIWQDDYGGGHGDPLCKDAIEIKAKYKDISARAVRTYNKYVKASLNNHC